MGYYVISRNNKRIHMTELEILKKMLSEGWEQARKEKKKNMPTFGVEMYLLQCIIQCNKALNEKNESK